MLADDDDDDDGGGGGDDEGGCFWMCIYIYTQEERKYFQFEDV